MENPPRIKKRRPFLFWVGVSIASFAVLYPVSFGPACWLDSLRKPEAKSLAISKPLNVYYDPIIRLVQHGDNDFFDLFLRYAELFAADGRQMNIAVLAPPGARLGTPWLVWYRRDLQFGAWLGATPMPDEGDRAPVNPPAPTPPQVESRVERPTKHDC